MSRFKPVLPAAPLPRIDAVTAADLALPGVLLERDIEAAAAWTRHVPMAPAEFQRLLLAGMPRPTDSSRRHVWLGWNGEGNRLTLCFYMLAPDGSRLLSDVRDFDFGRGYVVHRELELDGDWQGQGIARQRLVNALQLYPALGLPAIRLNAGNSVGGYAWARMGFLPPAWNWTVLRQGLRDRLDFMSDIAPGPRAQAEALLASDDPRALWQVADLPAEAPGEEPLGATLLLGSQWIAQLDFDNPQQMARLHGYLFPAGGAAPRRTVGRRPG